MFYPVLVYPGYQEFYYARLPCFDLSLLRSILNPIISTRTLSKKEIEKIMAITSYPIGFLFKSIKTIYFYKKM